MKRLSPRQFFVCIGACLLVLGVLAAISPGMGSTSQSFGWWDAWRARLGIPITAEELQHRPLVDRDGDGVISAVEHEEFVENARFIGFQLRLPRTLLALVVGLTLGLCGAVFQVLFRNPLATPYTLGISSGGSLGALVALRLGWTASVGGLSAVTLSAFAGGMGIVTMVYLLARGSRRLTSNELLLAGVTMGMFCSAMMMVVTMLSDARQTTRMIWWMMGSMDTITDLKLRAMLPLLVPAWIVLLGAGRSLNQYLLGEELAMSRGVRVVRLEITCVIAAALAVSSVVAMCGPIGFVGLVVPHIASRVVGADCRVLLPASALIGGAFLIVCDWASQSAMPVFGRITGRDIGSASLPIGVTTAVVGVPLFLILLNRTRRAVAWR